MNILRGQIVKELMEAFNLPNEEGEEHLRIELYKTLQSIAPTLSIEKNTLRLDISEMNRIMRGYGY